MNKKLLSLIHFIIAILAFESAYAFDHSHSSFQKTLDTFVVTKGAQTLVNYQGLKNSPSDLNDYLGQLTAIKQNDFESWSKTQQLATLINAYNAWTIKLIIDNYPVKSIKDIGTLFTSAWKKKFFKWLGQDSYLDFIEHEQVRKIFKEPRIHFALVCASISCPSLSPKVFLSEKLDSQLEEASHKFLGDKNKNRIAFTNPLKLEISSIFDWYGSDFKNLNQFVSERITSDRNIANLIKQGSYDKEYLDYDWNLNDAKNK
ncbi:MAG: DUF547 domain-containing protein [Bacteriovoracaceae bacterium]|nr:DUF547 domain-containing protein [Bacteriovoracaceae bacterium]